MIKRNYFYSGFIERQHTGPDNFDGIITVTSFLPSPLTAWKQARQDIEKGSMAYTGGQQVRIKTMVRI